MMDFLERLGSIFLRRRPAAPGLYVGDALSVLRPCGRLFFRNSPAGVSAASIPGFAWKRVRSRLCIRPSTEPNPHIVIAGMSGFGKSSLFKHMLADLASARIPCIVFDAQNEHEGLVRALGGTAHDARYSGINLLELAGASVSERISELTHLFRSVYSLGYIQATKLSQCLWYTYRKSGAQGRSATSLDRTPTIRDLLSELQVFVRNAKSVGERNALLHLQDRLSLLNTTAFSAGEISSESIGRGITSFSLSGMKSREAQVIYIGELLRRLYLQMHASTRERGLSTYIAIDEVQFLTGAGASSSAVIRGLIEEGRKYGFGIIIVTHAASGLDRQIIANASSIVAFYSREPSEAGYVTRLLSGGDPLRADAIRERLRSLRQHEAVVLSCGMRDPMVVRTPSMQDLEERLGAAAMHRSSLPGKEGSLRSVSKQPQQYGELAKRFSTQDLDSAVSDRTLDRLDVRCDGNDETWIMPHRKSPGIEHEVYVAKMHSMLGSLGIRNYVMDNSRGPDIVVLSGGKRIALEYETGAKRLRESATMIKSRKRDYALVAVFTNARAHAFYQRYFEGEQVLVLNAEDLKASMERLQDSLKSLIAVY